MTWSFIDFLVPGYSRRAEARKQEMEKVKAEVAQAQIEGVEALDHFVKTAATSRRLSRELDDFAAIVDQLANNLGPKKERIRGKTTRRS